ncbi:MAG: M14 family metallopeptidase [Lysobacterales bacterium]
MSAGGRQRWWWCAWLLAVLAGCAPAPQRPPSATEAAVALQQPQQWCFADDGVCFDNQLPAARLNGVERLGPDHYRLLIRPEIEPINPSPWYGFRLRSEPPRALQIELDYGSFEHRYWPKLSLDGERWRLLSQQEFELDDRGEARMQLPALASELQIYAQPPLGEAEFDALLGRVQSRVADVQVEIFGQSVQGRPLRLFEFGGTADSPWVIVLGRQHPPENTGSQALLSFVDTLTGDSPQAHDYRRRVRTLVVPMLNPDGVALGHWRGNAHGRDLNRDWGPFEQPETRALRDALLARTGPDGRPVLFAIDFHSTWSDVLYSVEEDPSRQPGGLLRGWIEAMDARFPGRIEEQAFAAATSVFKNWAYCQFGATAVTYEVGDDTTAEQLDDVARTAAFALMAVSERPLPERAPACAAASGAGPGTGPAQSR